MGLKNIQYEDFGAFGDGINDDMRAICNAHDYANAHNLPVTSNPDAEYFIGSNAMTAIIKTDTDWSTTKFIIDDRFVNDNTLPCFIVSHTFQPYELKIEKLDIDQKHLDFYPDQTCYVRVVNSSEKKFIRFGLNQNMGIDQNDCFILNKDGNITSPIDWKYEHITSIKAWPISDSNLFIKGGIFTTIANQGESIYNYYSRGIDITRSNTIVDGVTHYIVGEGSHGSPYQGFFTIMDCANVTLQNCFLSGHKTYETIGSANLPVMMGSYDLYAHSVINFTLRNCQMNHITDNSRWGVIGSNFCKNILVEDCILSRLDAHMGVSGTYIVRNSQLGWQGLNAIGRGTLTLSDVTFYGEKLLELRADYGSTWQGDLIIKDCKWVIPNNLQGISNILDIENSGMHDFGYKCYMPESIEIKNLFIDDSSFTKNIHNIYLFSDPSLDDEKQDLPSFEKRPYPYILSKKVTYSNMRTALKKPIYISTNEKLFDNVVLDAN